MSLTTKFLEKRIISLKEQQEILFQQIEAAKSDSEYNRLADLMPPLCDEEISLFKQYNELNNLDYFNSKLIEQ